MSRPVTLFVAMLALFLAPYAAAQKDAGLPKPETYLCPATDGTKAVDCFLNAVEHLYTMCRQVKSIEIIEFGYDKSDEGVNGAKSEYCVDKHKLSMTRPYQAALREATGSSGAVAGLRTLHELWLKALADLKWVPGESDEQYKARIAKPYSVFSEHANLVRVALNPAAAKAATPATTKAGAATTAKTSAQATTAAAAGSTAATKQSN